MKTTRNGRFFEITENANGVRLSYLGEEDNPFKQFITWLCDDMEEVEDMMEAIIDPNRYADDEYRVRHQEEFMSRCKW